MSEKWIQEAIQHLAGEFIVREAGPQSLITVTRVVLSDDNKYAKEAHQRSDAGED